MQKTVLTIINLIFFFSVLLAQSSSDTLSFKDRLQPLGEDNIFKSEEYYNWCSSIIKGEDEKYHLFYSRWPKYMTKN